MQLFRVLSRSIVIFAVMVLILTGDYGAIAGTSGKIAGKVTDADTNESLPGVNIVIKGTRMGSATDVEGDYFILNVPPGVYTVTATMMGYSTLEKTNVRVEADRTFHVNFSLKTSVLEGEVVTVVAEREVVPMDISASQIVTKQEEIVAIPVVRSVEDFLNMQPGIEDLMIRGGSYDQSAVVVDGMVWGDARTNKPYTGVALSAIKEVSILTGGFNAEYGNIRSGLINIITEEGQPDRYHFSVDFRYGIPKLKHWGGSIYSADNYLLRSFLDPAVCWVGTENGSWDEYTRQQNIPFMGWNEYSARTLADDDPTNDLTPQQAKQIVEWFHTVEGTPGNRGASDGDDPDLNADISFSGPVPVIGKYLGDLSFFAAFRGTKEMFPVPFGADPYYRDYNTSLKLSSNIAPNMKLTAMGMFGEKKSLEDEYKYSRGGYMRSLESIANFKHDYLIGRWMLYDRWLATPITIVDNFQSLKFTHTLNSNTFYEVKLNRNYTHYKATRGTITMRDTKKLTQIGPFEFDEAPFGASISSTNATGPATRSNFDASGKNCLARDSSKTAAYQLKFDLTSQVHKRHQVKMGFEFNYTDFDVYQYMRQGLTDEEVEKELKENLDQTFRVFPILAGAYLQDKIEYKGMIANVGLRLDYYDPNTKWYNVDPYSEYFASQYIDDFESLVESEEADAQWKLAPRLGISHPISDKAKLYFNWGIFHSLPTNVDLYQIDRGEDFSLAGLGNPNADIPKTIAYELGVDYDLLGDYLIHLAAYYKDNQDQIGKVIYTNLEGDVSYYTWRNTNYSDIRGFEIRIDKKFGRWISGWLNYHYMIKTSGYVGREKYYEDYRKSYQEGYYNPYQERPHAQPILRANINLLTPLEWGPTLAGHKILGGLRLSLLPIWRAGEFETWNPLNLKDIPEDNIQWKAYRKLDMRIEKYFNVKGLNFSLFADISNALNTKNMTMFGFANEEDKNAYYSSLHLPMYNNPQYKAAGYTGGDDQPGDYRSDDKPYINDPNVDFFRFYEPRYIFLGIRVAY